MPSHNERFGAMAGVVIIHTVVYRPTVSGSLNGVQLSRHFAKPPPVVCNASDSVQWDNEMRDLNINCPKGHKN